MLYFKLKARQVYLYSTIQTQGNSKCNTKSPVLLEQGRTENDLYASALNFKNERFHTDVMSPRKVMKLELMNMKKSHVAQERMPIIPFPAEDKSHMSISVSGFF